MRRLALGLCAALAVTACSGSPAESPDNDAGGPTTDSATLSNDRPLEPVGDPATSAVQGGGFPGQDRPVAHLADVDVAGHDGFDRFVLHFQGDRVPGYRVAYVEPPVTDAAAGRPVDIDGSAFLQVQAAPASAVDLSGERPEQTYDGPFRLAPEGAGVLVEAVGTGDLENVLTWTLGLDRKVPFGVSTLDDPARLVVDVLSVPADDVPGLEPVGTGDVADSIAAGDGPAVVLTDVRLGAHDGFDRIVFEVAGEGRAGWQVGYTSEPQAQGSGRALDVPGAATLGITLTNLASPPEDSSAAWVGPERQAIAGASVLDTLVEDTLFEGRYTFFAGVDARRPFAVGLLESPQRIVVDVLARAPATEPIDLSQRCASPAGFAVSYPGEWSVNSGETVPACTRFAPDPFTVPPGTDVRVGAVSVTVEDLPFDQVSQTGTAEVESRRSTTIDGRTAVRIELIHSAEGLYPAGTRATRYVVDLGSDEGGARSLVATTVGLPQFDYARNVRVLDRMVETLDLTEN